MDHSDRRRYVTNQVSMWVCNDRNIYFQARQMAAEVSAIDLGSYLIPIIQRARPHSTPWQVAQELAPNDYNRIDWSSVAEDLTADA